MRDNFLSVVVPTKGRAASIGGALKSVGNQSVAAGEVIIVDGTPKRMSADFLSQVFRGCRYQPSLIYIHAPEDRGLPAARNRGIRSSSGDVVQFLDDDAILAPDYFQQLLPVFLNVEIGAAAGLVIEPDRHESALRKKLFRFFYAGPFRQDRDGQFSHQSAGLHLTNTLPGVGAYRRHIFDEFVFDENLLGPAIGEDVDFSYRVGRRWRMVIEPSAKVYHYPSPDERLDMRANFSHKVKFYNYHYRKNIDKTFFSYFSYVWLNIGFILHALTTAKVKAFLGVFEGMCDILRFHPEYDLSQKIVKQERTNDL